MVQQNFASEKSHIKLEVKASITNVIQAYPKCTVQVQERRDSYNNLN